MASDVLSLDYDALARAYVDNLRTSLRNFSQGPEFLDGWAHDEDHGRSLLSMFEAAHDAGLPALDVCVRNVTLAQLDRGWLEAELARLGTLGTRQHADNTIFHVDFL